MPRGSGEKRSRVTLSEWPPGSGEPTLRHSFVSDVGAARRRIAACCSDDAALAVAIRSPARVEAIARSSNAWP